MPAHLIPVIKHHYTWWPLVPLEWPGTKKVGVSAPTLNEDDLTSKLSNQNSAQIRLKLLMIGTFLIEQNCKNKNPNPSHLRAWETPFCPPFCRLKTRPTIRGNRGVLGIFGGHPGNRFSFGLGGQPTQSIEKSGVFALSVRFSVYKSLFR